MQTLLDLPDSFLADLYSLWSEDRWCAGWISGGEEEFVEFLFGDKGLYRHPLGLTSYQEETIGTIRILIKERLEAE